jgi:hypothetical protein
LVEGHASPNLVDYSQIKEDSDIIEALQAGLKEAQSMLRVLNMAPSSIARDKHWFLQPWSIEALDPKHWSYVPAAKATVGEDGNGEVLRDAMAAAATDPTTVVDLGEGLFHLEEDLFDDRVSPVEVAQNECKDAISEMFNAVECPMDEASHSDTKIIPIVEFSGKVIYKSTLVSELNGNPYLSKDRLTRVRNFVYFNNAEEYLSAASSSTTILLGLGSDCGVMFVSRNSLSVSSTAKAARKRARDGTTKTAG